MRTSNVFTRPVIQRIAGLTLGLLSALNVSTGTALASTVLTATDTNIQLLDFSGSTSRYGIFAPGNTLFDTSLGYLPLAPFDRVSFSETLSGWTLREKTGAFNLELPHNRFVLALYSGGSWHADTGLDPAASHPDIDMYGMGFSSLTDSVTLMDVAPASVVPVPGAVWLFGSGLLGLSVVARRKKGAQ